MQLTWCSCVRSKQLKALPVMLINRSSGQFMLLNYTLNLEFVQKTYSYICVRRCNWDDQAKIHKLIMQLTQILNVSSAVCNQGKCSMGVLAVHQELHTLQKQVGCFNHKVWLQTSWRDGGYERFALVWKSNCIRQPKIQLPSSSYNHNILTTLRTFVKE